MLFRSSLNLDNTDFGSFFSNPYFLTIPIQSENVVLSQKTMPEPIEPKSLLTTSDITYEIAVQQRLSKILPPLTAEMCFLIAFISLIEAPDSSKILLVLIFCSNVTPSGAHTSEEVPPETKNTTKSLQDVFFKNARIVLPAKTEPESGVGCPARII